MNKLYILCGIPFSGKTTLAKEIIKFPNFVRIDLDEIKFEMFGNGVKDSDINQEDWDKIYQEMYKRIENALKQEVNVVHDTGNFTKYERGLIRDIASKLNLETITIFVDTPKNVAYQRLLENRKTNQRFDVIDEDFRSTVAEMEIPREDENTIVFETTNDPETWAQGNLIH